MFFYVHINTYANYVTKLVMSCDVEGNYTKTVIPKKHFFMTDINLEEVLTQSRDNKDNVFWFK